jgi:hypothetical protein
MAELFDLAQYEWSNGNRIAKRDFVCGYCSRHIASDRGLALVKNSRLENADVEDIKAVLGGSYICPNCKGATFVIPDSRHFPSPVLGEPVNSVPSEMNALYEEARRCISQNCYTATALLCRKMLMNIAVENGAKEGLGFVTYVDYLVEENHISPKWKPWVDHIRKRGNVANHQIALTGESDARDLLRLTSMLLKILYEVPNIYQPPSPSS